MNRIIYEDNHLIAVIKRSGEIVQGDKTGDKPLSEEIKSYLKTKYKKPGNVFLGTIHRLDRPTSGIVLFAKTSKSLSRMNELFKNKKVQKTYFAVTEDMPKKEKGVIMLDIAKALLDYGFHAPTIYFPNNIPEAMMIEPTESETKETLDRFSDVMLEINEKINTNPDLIRQTPIKTPVTRLNETKANRELNLKWTP